MESADTHCTRQVTLTASALILAGGLGTRMGYDKQLIRLGGERNMDRLLAGLREGFDELLVSTRTPQYYAEKDVVVLADDIGRGPMAGVYQGLKHCSSEYLYVVACDMPFYSMPFIEYMRTILDKERVGACVTEKENGFYEPFHAFYHKRTLPLIEKCIVQGNYSLNNVFAQTSVHAIDRKTAESYEKRLFYNINRQEDLETAERILQEETIL